MTDPAELAKLLRQRANNYDTGVATLLYPEDAELDRAAAAMLDQLASTAPKTIFGLPVVIDETMPPDTFKIVHEPARTMSAEEVRERALQVVEQAGNFGDYKRHELTEDYGQPRFDFMRQIMDAIRAMPLTK